MIEVVLATSGLVAGFGGRYWARSRAKGRREESSEIERLLIANGTLIQAMWAERHARRKLERAILQRGVDVGIKVEPEHDRWGRVSAVDAAINLQEALTGMQEAAND